MNTGNINTGNINNRIGNNNFNNINVNNRQAWGGNWNNGYRPPYYNRGNWYHGGWGWNGPGWWGAAGAFGTGWLLGATTGAFSNPYYAAPVVGSGYAYDYSQPLPIYDDVPSDTYYPAPVIINNAPQDVPIAAPVVPDTLPPPVFTEGSSPTTTEDAKTKEAAKNFAMARELFKWKDYSGALTAIDQAIKALPNDTALHEFRALDLFAQKRYKDAAAVIYSVLAVGPGWNYDTLKSFYEDWHTYDAQLKDLQSYVAANPNDAAALFLLAYHCLVLDQRQQAVTLLNRVVQINPQDQLAAAMSQAISQSLTPVANDRPSITP